MGGVSLQQSLMTRRHCISFCKYNLEAISLEAKCSQTLEDNPPPQEWFGFVVSSQKQNVEINDARKETLDDVKIDKQPSQDEKDEDEGEMDKESSVDDE